jgi:hypothetical protein
VIFHFSDDPTVLSSIVLTSSHVLICDDFLRWIISHSKEAFQVRKSYLVTDVLDIVR